MEKSKPANTFEWAQRINENEYYLTDISLSELGDLLAYVRKAKQKAENFAISVNPPLDPRRQSRFWIEADFIEAAVLQELHDRQVLIAAPALPPAQEDQRRKGNMAINAKTFGEMFCTPNGKDLAISAAEKAGLIEPSENGKWQWDYEHTTGAIRAFFDALQDTPGLIHKIKVTPGCKLIAREFGVKEVKNYPEADFTPRLRKEIKSYLTKQQG